MSWKTDLQLRDLDPASRFEVTCLKCGSVRYIRAGDLMTIPKLMQLYLDEIETRLNCRQQRCRGRCRIALGHNHQNEGFVGGLA